MSALSIPAPFPIFSDTTGAPLNSGYIYIGAANQDPVTNPIAAYWDAALTISAVQPIRTSGGYPVYNGSPANIYVNTDYSIRVNNSNSVLVYSAPTATGRFSSVVISGIDASNVSYTPAGLGSVPTNVQSKFRENTSVVDQGADPAGTANSTASFAKARAITNRYYIPTGTYILDASPDPFLDCFTSGSGVTLIVGGVSYDCSNAFAGPLRYVAASATKTNVVHAKTGNVIQYWQDGAPGTATGFYRGLAVTTDSHFAQVQPATNGGSTDLLFQRSTLNADPAGNRFNITFEESGDRLLYSFATTASGAPSFDTAWAINAGTAATMTFPGLQGQFNQGVTVKQRAAGGFVAGLIPTSSTTAGLQQVGGSNTTYLNFRDGAFGFFGSSGTSQQTVTGSRGGNAALASLITALTNTGLIVDGTTA